MEALRVQEPLTAVEWSDQHFYLSAESSYIEGPWTTQPIQKAILNMMGNDDIGELDFRKSARIGYTKMLLAAALYLAEHKRRNIGIWREDDDAAAEFVNTELDPAIRDCEPIKDIFPGWYKKSENNKVDYKKLLGCSIHIRGGQAAGGYRALSKDVVIGDEIDGFVQNVGGKASKEGDPVTLMFKRTKGSSFPKKILGTTPTVSGASHIERREKAAEITLRCYIKCPHCEGLQYLKWGDPGSGYGIKWINSESKTESADSAQYLCEHCSVLFDYNQFLDVLSEDDPVWIDEERNIATKDGIHFYNYETGREVKTPRHVCVLIWAAYSPTTPWSEIVAEYLDAKDDKLTLQGFVNTTLGEYWHSGVKEKLNSDTLFRRREYYPKSSDGEYMLPAGALYLTAGVDTQDNRFAYEIVAWGKSRENWSVEYREVKGRPDEVELQDLVVEHISKTFLREDGARLPVSLVFHDAGGSFFDDILQMSARIDPNWWIACKGDYQVGTSYIKESHSKKAEEFGCYLYMVGTTTVGDFVSRQFKKVDPAPICHWPISTEEDGHYTGHDRRYFEMLTAEERKLKRVRGKDVWLWECPSGVRNEAWDCRRYAAGAMHYAEQYLGVDLQNGLLPAGQTAIDAPQQHADDHDDYWD